MKVKHIPCTLAGLFNLSWYTACREMHEGRHQIANNLSNSAGEQVKRQWTDLNQKSLIPNKEEEQFLGMSRAINNVFFLDRDHIYSLLSWCVKKLADQIAN